MSARESVWAPPYTRPPTLQETKRHLRVVWTPKEGGEEIVLADSKNAFRVLETSHPPTYYIPPSDVNTSYLTKNARSSYCEWKGSASYFDVAASNTSVKNRIWTYADPSSRFKQIKDHFSFYVGPWRCFVDGEEVHAQPGDFYGGWMTSDIDGGSRGVKGGPGTYGW